MNKKLSNIPFYCIFAVTIILLLIGAFYDLNISQALYVGRDNPFGIFFASIGVGFSFFFYCLYGGFLFSDALYHQTNKLLRFLLLCYGVGMTVCSWFVASSEFTGYDAYNMGKSSWVVYLFFIPISVGLFFLGYIKGKENKIKNIWLVICLMIFVMLISYEGVVNLIKHGMRRPRYRELVDGGLSLDFFHKFYEPFKEYQFYIDFGINKNEFKSLPSGHACNSCLMIMQLSYLPIVFPKLENKRKLLFYIGLAYAVLISFTRLMVGAHFLTDVTIGFLATFTTFFIFNNIVDKKILK